jgi:hyperosmotically inducible protein
MKTITQFKKTLLGEASIAIACLSVVLGLAACQEEKGPAEKAGQKIDQAAEKVEQKYDIATSKAEQQIEAAKESVDKNVDKAQEAIIKSTEATKGAMEKTGIKIDLATQKLEDKVGSVKESVVEKAETAGALVDDAVISANVKAAILSDSLMKASHIEVATSKGVVTLKGTVDSEPILGRAMEIASSQKHVKSVKTDLIVSILTPSK